MWLVAALVVLVMLAGLGGWVAIQRNRAPTEGLILGLLYGPLGVIVEALLPVGERQPEPVDDDDEPLPEIFREAIPALPSEAPRKPAPAPLKDLRL